MAKTTGEKLQEQLKRLEKRTGKPPSFWMEQVAKHAPKNREAREEWLKVKHHFSNTEAKALVRMLYEGLNEYDDAELLKKYFRNGKEYQKAIYDKLLLYLKKFGRYQVTANQNYLTLSNSRQFAIVKPTVGGLMIGVPGAAVRAAKHKEFKPTGTFSSAKITHRILLNDESDLNLAVIRVLKASFERS